MFASLNSKLYTVAALREIAERMELDIKGKPTKATLAGIISDAIDILHGEVLLIETLKASQDADWQDAVNEANGILFVKQLGRESQFNRANVYVAQRGTYKLTAAQWRRIRKNNAKYGLTTEIRNNGTVAVSIV